MTVKSTSLRLVETDGEPGDSELIAGAMNGDARSFELLVRRYQKKIFAVAFAICRNEHEADGITQDTFVQAYTHLDQFEGRAGFETWLTRIAINRSRDVLRIRRVAAGREFETESEFPALQIVDPAPDAARIAESRQLRRAIDEAVAGLPTQQKIIFRLRHFDDLSLEEIASTLGLRPGTVRAHLFRAMHKVRALLGSWRQEHGRQKDISDETL